MQSSQSNLSGLGKELYEQLARLHANKEHVSHSSAQKVHVAGVGTTISVAYEQLRKAAENAEEHLVRQRAIKRFLNRALFLSSGKDVGEELVIELTEAGYIENDSIDLAVVDRINAAISHHYAVYEAAKKRDVSHIKMRDWTLELLSVECDWLIGADATTSILATVAYKHFAETIDKSQFQDVHDFEVSLYVAVRKTLLKSDLANIRYDLVKLYQQTGQDVDAYIEFNKRIDDIFSSKPVERLSRYVTRYGAPFHILKSLIRDNPRAHELLASKVKFNTAYEAQIVNDYEATKAKLNKGVIKSIIFLLITKALIGLAIEIPYDLVVYGSIIILPLAINLFFPAAYMAILRLTMSMPGAANANAIREYMAAVLFKSDQTVLSRMNPPAGSKRFSAGYNIIYVLMIILVFALVIERLIALDFNFVQGAIFFVFLSTASFLGFRLSRMIREIELIPPKASFVSIVRDFLYTPFVVLGQWISARYAKLNIVAIALDVIIELPLKTILRLLRQWVAFLNAKKEEI